MSDYKEKTYLVKDSLIVIEPLYRLNSFVVHSGNIFKQAVPVNADGLYRLPTQCYRNGVELTLVASIVAVDATSKYYYESGFLYTYLPASDFITMRFQLFYGSRGFKLPRGITTGDIVYFEPRITGNPSFNVVQKDKFKGISVTGDSSFSLINTNQDIFEPLDDLLNNALYSFVNKPVKIYRYLSQEDYQPIQLIFAGVISSWDYDRVKISFKANDYVRSLDKSIQTVEYNTTNYPNCNPSMLGRVERVIYGQLKVKCCNIDYVDGGDQTQNRVWKIALHPNKSVSSVMVNDQVLTLTTHYTLNADKNQITLVDNMETALAIDTLNANDELTCVVEGKMDGSSNLIDNASDIVKDILLAVGFSLSELETASFTQAKTDNTYKIAVSLPEYVDGERPTATEVIEKINRSVFGYLSNSNDYKIRYKIYSDGAASAELSKDSDLIGWRSVAETMDIVSTVVVRYEYDELLGDYKYTKTYENETSKYLHNVNKSDTIDSVLRLEADALDMATKHATFFGRPYKLDDFNIKLQLDDKSIGDFIEYDATTYEIIKLDKSIKDTAVTVRRI